MNSLKKTLILVNGIIVTVVVLVSVVLAYGFARSAAIKIVEDNFEDMTVLASQYIAAEMDKDMAILEALSLRETLKDGNIPWSEKIADLSEVAPLNAPVPTAVIPEPILSDSRDVHL